MSPQPSGSMAAYRQRSMFLRFLLRRYRLGIRLALPQRYLGEGMRAAIEEIEGGFRQMIEGWERQ
jgi:hypothetical protein